MTGNQRWCRERLERGEKWVSSDAAVGRRHWCSGLKDSRPPGVSFGGAARGGAAGSPNPAPSPVLPAQQVGPEGVHLCAEADLAGIPLYSRDLVIGRVWLVLCCA